MEMAERNVGQLQTSDSGTREVQAVSERYRSKKQSYNRANETPQAERQAKGCYRCGGKQRAEVCRFRPEKCRKCGKIGHIAKNVAQESMQIKLPILTLIVTLKTR